MRLQLNHQFIHSQYGLKASPLNKALFIASCCRNFTVLSYFDVKKQRPKTDIEKCYHYLFNYSFIIYLLLTDYN